jgi:hypothetical protein
MTIELTEQQRQQLDQDNGAVRLLDPDTQKAYVLVRAELFDRLQGVLSAEFNPSEAYPAIDRTFAEGWDDPAMDIYDRYEEFKK